MTGIAAYITALGTGALVLVLPLAILVAIWGGLLYLSGNHDTGKKILIGDALGVGITLGAPTIGAFLVALPH